MEDILVSNIMKNAQSQTFVIIFNMAFDPMCHVRHNLLNLRMT